jgi:protein-arginine kinase activator protein McsA
MICQVCNERSAAFERGAGTHALRICYSCLSRTGMHLLGGWRLIPVGDAPPPCPDCGQTWEAFARSGRYGCPGCATRFHPALRRLLEAPVVAPGPVLAVPGHARQALADPAEAELSLALLLEDYELAARIRDRSDGGPR